MVHRHCCSVPCEPAHQAAGGDQDTLAIARNRFVGDESAAWALEAESYMNMRLDRRGKSYNSL